MKPILPFLKKMLTTSGLSGNETPIREIIYQEWKPYVDEISTSPLGNLYGIRYGRTKPTTERDPDGPSNRPSLLFTAHMDSIGLIVTSILDGFIRFTEMGHLDHRILPGQRVIVHGVQEIPGIVVLPGAHLLPAELQGGPTPIDYLFVDTGLSAVELNRQVHPGDWISFAQIPVELEGELLAGHSLDNRASVAALTLALQELVTRDTTWDIIFAATVQEEETLAGAYTAGFHFQPSMAVVLDVTFATSPNSNSYQTFPLGGGITLGWGSNIHPYLYNILKDLALELEIPFATEYMPGSSGTDAILLQVAAEGIPTMVVSIPVRYMHSPLEIVAMTDIERAGRLVSAFAQKLDYQTMQSITWEY